MGDWKLFLKGDPLPWLLEEDNPTVRYLALTEIHGVPADAPEAAAARAAIMRTGAAPRILAAQAEGGWWEAPDAFYTAKYQGTVWQLIILAELRADGRDEQIRRACEFILDAAQDLQSGGFAIHRAVKAGGGRHSEVIPCLTGNMVWSLLRLGHGDLGRIQRGIDWLTSYQRFDDAEGEAPQGWPYDKYEMCWGRHTCHLGVVKTLKALAEIPADQRTPAVQSTVDAGVEYLLRHHLYKRSHDLSKTAKPGWTRFGFPFMYQTDVLEILEILTRLGCHDPRLRAAVELVLSRQDASGRWLLANSFNDRLQVQFEAKGQPSKWITLNALRVLKRHYA